MNLEELDVPVLAWVLVANPPVESLGVLGVVSVGSHAHLLVVLDLAVQDSHLLVSLTSENSHSQSVSFGDSILALSVRVLVGESILSS